MYRIEQEAFCDFTGYNLNDMGPLERASDRLF
jgi:hypothetical protein